MKTNSNLIRLPIIINSVFAFFWLFLRFFTPVYLEENLGLSIQKIGFLYGIFAIAGIVFVFPAGIGSDRFSPRKIVQIFSFGMFLSSLFLYLFNSFWILILIFFLFGLSKNASNIALNAEVFKKVDNKNMGLAFGKYHFAGAFFAAMGMIAGGLVLYKIDFKYAFLIQAFGFFCAFLLSGKLSQVKTIEIKLINHLKDFLKPKVLMFCLVLFLFSIHWGAEDVAYGLFLKYNLNLSEKMMGFYMAGEVFLLGCSALFFGKKIQNNNISFSKIMFIGLFLSGITHILMTVPIFWFSFIARMIHGIGDGAMSIVLFFGIKKLFHVDRIGGSGGLVMLVNMLGGFVGSIIFGIIATYGYSLPFIISGFISIFIVFIVYFWRKFFEH